MGTAEQEALRKQLWMWFGGGSTDGLEWTRAAKKKIQKDLGGDAKEIRDEIEKDGNEDFISRLRTESSKSGKKSGSDNEKTGLDWIADLPDEFLKAFAKEFALDLALSSIPVLSQLSAFPRLIKSGVMIVVKAIKKYMVKKAIKHFQASPVGAKACEALNVSLSAELKRRGLEFGTYVMGAASAYLDPTQISNVAGPASRLVLKLCWLIAEWKRVQDVNRLLSPVGGHAINPAFDINIIDKCPYLGCWLFKFLPPDALYTGFNLKDSTKLYKKQYEIFGKLKSQAATVCGRSLYELPTHEGVLAEQEFAPGIYLQAPRLYMVVREFRTDLNAGDLAGIPERWDHGTDTHHFCPGEVYFYGSAERTRQLLESDCLDDLGGSVLDFAFSVNWPESRQFDNYDLQPNESVWMYWDTDEEDAKIKDRMLEILKQMGRPKHAPGQRRNFEIDRPVWETRVTLTSDFATDRASLRKDDRIWADGKVVNLNTQQHSEISRKDAWVAYRWEIEESEAI